MDLASPRRREPGSHDVADGRMRASVYTFLLEDQMPLDERVAEHGRVQARNAVQVGQYVGATASPWRRRY